MMLTPKSLKLPAKIEPISISNLLKSSKDEDIDTVECVGELIISHKRDSAINKLIAANLCNIIGDVSIGTLDSGKTLYILSGNVDDIKLARMPNLSFLQLDRITDYLPYSDTSKIATVFTGTPDLAVEILSPDSQVRYWLRRLCDYLEAGTSEVWLILPKRGELHQYRQDAYEPVVYRFGDIFETPLFPNLKISIDEIFKK